MQQDNENFKKLTSVGEIKDYFKLCNDIKKSDSKIRFVGVINERGKLVAGGMNEKIKSLTERKYDEMLFIEVALKVKMRKEFDKQLGSVNFTMSQRKRILGIGFPLGINDTLCVFAEPDSEYSKLIKKIQIILDEK